MRALKVFSSVASEVPEVYQIKSVLAVDSAPAAASLPNAVAVLDWLHTAVYLAPVLKPLVILKSSSTVKSPVTGFDALDQVARVKVAYEVTDRFAMAHSQALAAF